MTLWFRRTRGLDSELMREIATEAGVSWDSQPIIYRGGGIGFKHGDPSDVAALQDAAETFLGYRPVEIDAPPEPTSPDQ
jgi:hypothetical protein